MPGKETNNAFVEKYGKWADRETAHECCKEEKEPASPNPKEKPKKTK